ncbi:MAG TPA: SBBP repeat-containing protein, partial [Acidimicrobiales bacterium]|nr:SBBP repeat-containing protein [Acidimicrobiales bacterium]
TYHLAAGADPSQVRVAWHGADPLAITPDGRLAVTTPVRTVEEDAPKAFQDVHGRRVPVEVAFELHDAESYGFRLGHYDRTLPLVIDPAVLLYAGFLGGAGNEFSNGIAVDGSGNAYVTGLTGSGADTFPETPGALQATNNGAGDVFVAKVNPTGSSLLYATFLGGSGEDIGHDIAVDGAGVAYVTGATNSTDFPTANPIQATAGGLYDAFLVKLNAAGSALVYATYLGGSGQDHGYGVAVDGAGNAYLAGETSSSNMPTANALQATNGGLVDAFVAKVNAAGSALVYSSYLGGSGTDVGTAIALDGAANAYLTGFTDSTNFPTANPLQAAQAGSNDAFLAKLNASGTALVYATYLGGSSNDTGIDVAVDAAGNAVVAGATLSSDFPTANALQAVNAGAPDAFVAKVNAAGSALVSSTYLGGAAADAAFSLALDASGNAYLSGQTLSDTFPTANPFQATRAGSVDAFVAKLNAAGTALVYSSYLGGAQQEVGQAIAVDAAGNAYVTGFTASPAATFPETSGVFQPAPGGSNDAFVAKVAESAQAPPFTLTITGDHLGPVTVTAGQSVLITKARVVGPVIVNPGGALTVVDSQITGGVTASGPTFFSMCGTQVAGPPPATALSVTGAPVPIQVGDPAAGCAGNRFAGQVVLSGNVGVTFGGNTVSHNATVDNNGAGATVVKANTVFGTLGCAGNNPAPTNAGQPNTAGAKTGQCALL